MPIVFPSGGGTGGTVSAPLTLTGTSDDVELTLVGAPGQNANLQEWKQNGGQVLALVDNAGDISVGQVAAGPSFPATALLVTQESTGARDIAKLTTIAGGIFVKVGKQGALIFNLNAAPDSADLAANQCALWFDSTNGAAKLMAKGKTADGTVVAASVAMA